MFVSSLCLPFPNHLAWTSNGQENSSREGDVAVLPTPSFTDGARERTIYEACQMQINRFNADNISQEE